MKNLLQPIYTMHWKRLFATLLTVWLGANILQSIFTEVMNDEAYYALYGDRLAWGYFDHPPMVALMTHVSALLFGGNLSVRFLTVCLQALTLVFLWKLLEEKLPTAGKTLLFFVLSGSMIMFATYGFVASPDAPLLFFCTLFLYAYQRFLKHESWANSLLLCLAMAGMIYSKYHAFIIIGLVFLSNLRLFVNKKMWAALALTAALALPHILWQAEMDYPSFKYHLIGRSFGFQWDEFLGHLPNQLVVFNPLVIGAVVYILVKYKPRDLFERALFFQIIGFQLFFFLMTFKGYVQPHWTAPTSMAMIVLMYRYCGCDPKLLRFAKHWIAPTILLIVAMRILLVADVLPKRLDFYGKEKHQTAVAQATQGLPVVYTGSFQRSSCYQYFTKQESLLLSGVSSRQTQFDIWQNELNYQGQSVFIFGNAGGRGQEFDINGERFYGWVTNNFQSVNRLIINYQLPENEASSGDTLRIAFELINPCDFDVDFHHPEFPVSWKIAFAKKRKLSIYDCSSIAPQMDGLKAHASCKGSLLAVVPEEYAAGGKYQIALSLDNTIVAAKNSNFTTLNIKPQK